MVQVTLADGQVIQAGTRVVNNASLRLFVTPRGAVLSGRTYDGIDFQIPIEGVVGFQAEDKDAREAVLSYLAAAWALHQWDRLNEWMAAREDAEGLSVWRLAYIRPNEELDRARIEQEVEAWLEKSR